MAKSWDSRRLGWWVDRHPHLREKDPFGRRIVTTGGCAGMDSKKLGRGMSEANIAAWRRRMRRSVSGQPWLASEPTPSLPSSPPRTLCAQSALESPSFAKSSFDGTLETTTVPSSSLISSLTSSPYTSIPKNGADQRPSSVDGQLERALPTSTEASREDLEHSSGLTAAEREVVLAAIEAEGTAEKRGPPTKHSPPLNWHSMPTQASSMRRGLFATLRTATPTPPVPHQQIAEVSSATAQHRPRAVSATAAECRLNRRLGRQHSLVSTPSRPSSASSVSQHGPRGPSALAHGFEGGAQVAIGRARCARPASAPIPSVALQGRRNERLSRFNTDAADAQLLVSPFQRSSSSAFKFPGLRRARSCTSPFRHQWSPSLGKPPGLPEWHPPAPSQRKFHWRRRDLDELIETVSELLRAPEQAQSPAQVSQVVDTAPECSLGEHTQGGELQSCSRARVQELWCLLRSWVSAQRGDSTVETAWEQLQERLPQETLADVDTSQLLQPLQEFLSSLLNNAVAVDCGDADSVQSLATEPSQATDNVPTMTAGVDSKLRSASSDASCILSGDAINEVRQAALGLDAAGEAAKPPRTIVSVHGRIRPK